MALRRERRNRIGAVHVFSDEALQFVSVSSAMVRDNRVPPRIFELLLPASLFAACLVIGISQPLSFADSGDAIPVSIDWTAPTGCSDPDTFFRGVSARLPRVRREDANPSSVRLQVSLARGVSEARGTLNIQGPRVESEARSVTGKTCDEVVQGLSLTAALALDSASARPATASVPPSKPVATSTRRQPPRATEAAAVAKRPPPDTVAVAAPQTNAPPANPPSTPAETPPSNARESAVTPAPHAEPAAAEPPRPQAVPPPPDLPAGPPVIAAPSTAESRAPEVTLNARTLAANIMSGAASLGGSIGVDLSTRPIAQEAIPFTVGLNALYFAGRFLANGASGDITRSYAAGMVSVCPPWGVQTALLVQLCAFGVGGWLTARDNAATTPQTVGRTWGGGGALLKGTWPLAAGFALGVELGAFVPFVKRRFSINDPPIPIVETSSLTLQAGLGLSYRL